MSKRAKPEPAGKKRKAARPAASAESARIEAPPPEPLGPKPLLSSTYKKDDAEEYGADERALNEFIKLHPLLSLELTSSKTLEIIASCSERVKVRVPELEVVGKRHDDLFFAPANPDIGERDCVCGIQCMGNFIANLRYGAGNDRAYTVKEYLTPSQLASFVELGKQPAVRGKCLLCIRYFVTYLYTLARADPSFRVGDSVQVQQFENLAAPGALDAAEAPAFVNKTSCEDGYDRSALLFVDEQAFNNAAVRESGLSTLCFRPFVKFNSRHYAYITLDGRPAIVQTGLEHQPSEELRGLHFRRPAPATGAPTPATV